MDNQDNILHVDPMTNLVQAVEEATPEEVVKMRTSVADTSSVEAEGGEDGYSEEIKNISLDSSYEDLLINNPNKELSESNASIFDVAEGKGTEISDEVVEDRVKDQMSAMFDLPDEEMIDFCQLINEYRKDKSSIPNVYYRMPESVKRIIQNVGVEQGVPWTEYNRVARMFMDELISQAELDDIFVDFERSLNEALKIPTLSDMYSEHTKEVMDVKIPEIIEKIKDTEPENAKTLERIRDEFHEAYSLKRMKEHFSENARTRKLMRRDYEKVLRFCDEFNLMNTRSKFKMPDCRSIIPALDRVLIEEELPDDSRIIEMDITEKDVSKFIVLFCRSCMNMNADDIFDAAYMYYALKNITMLNLTNETKTPFAAELINNICDIIEFVREEEDKFDAGNKSNKRKSKSNKKLR